MKPVCPIPACGTETDRIDTAVKTTVEIREEIDALYTKVEAKLLDKTIDSEQ
jgi:hypothetical protein